MAAILTIDTLVERSEISINGTLYGIRNDDELSVLAGRRLRHLTGRIAALEAKSGEETTAEEKSEYEQLTAEVCAIVLDAPAAVLAMLKSGHKVAIIQAFIQLRREKTEATAPGAKSGRHVPRKRTGAKSSRN